LKDSEQNRLLYSVPAGAKFVEIVDKALEKDRDVRYQSAGNAPT
jgi:hypothetical protein